MSSQVESEAKGHLFHPAQIKPLQVNTKAKKRSKKQSFFHRISKKYFTRSSSRLSSGQSVRALSNASRSSSTSSLRRTAVVQRHSRSRSRGGRSLFSCTGGQRSRSCTPERNATTSCQLPVTLPLDLLHRLQQERESSYHNKLRPVASSSSSCPSTSANPHTVKNYNYTDSSSDENDDEKCKRDSDEDGDDEDEIDDDSGVDDGDEYSGSIDKFKCDIPLDNYIIGGTRASSGRSTLKSSVYSPSALSESDYSPTCVEDVSMDFSKFTLSHSGRQTIGKRLASLGNAHQPLVDVTNAQDSGVIFNKQKDKVSCRQLQKPRDLQGMNKNAGVDSDRSHSHGIVTHAKVSESPLSDPSPSYFSLSRLSFKKKKKKQDRAKSVTETPKDNKSIGAKACSQDNDYGYTYAVRRRAKSVMEHQTTERQQKELVKCPVSRTRLRSQSEERASSSSRPVSAYEVRPSSEPRDFLPRKSSHSVHGSVSACQNHETVRNTPKPGSTASTQISSLPCKPQTFHSLGTRCMKGRPLPPIPGEADSASSQPPAKSTYATLPTHGGTRSRTSISNSPNTNPPPEGGITHVKTIPLDKVVKNKWISGLAVTKKNEYIIVDLKEAYLVDENGSLKRNIGAKGSNRLLEPIDVDIMANGNIVFSDHAGQDVKIYNCKGQFLQRVRDDTLTNIAGVATTERNEIVIAGTDKQRISVHSTNDELIDTIQSDKDGKCLFEHPYTVAVNPLTGDIIVGDDSKQQVSALSADGKRVLWRYCPSGGRERHFFPSSICVDTDGYVFIADLYNEKVYMLDSSGKFLKTLLSRGNGLKGGPGAIAVDGKGHLLVADEERTIKVFRYGKNGFALYRRITVFPDAV